ncbi:MAG: chromate transporter [Pseudanabaenaceae cyanobacterium bins.39]|nr:chromate transporter [Pseudanabaenaceae cyanobacterium bins.39]
MTIPNDNHQGNYPPSLPEIVLVFAKLGAIAFGGPAAHVAQIEQEVVQRRQWINRERLLDLLSIANLIPGPNSTELTIHIGLEQRGWRGAIAAGVSFILPAMVIVWTLAAIYSHYRTIPAFNWLLNGIKPVIIAIITTSIWKLGKAACKNRLTAIAGIIVLSFYFLSINEIVLMLGAGVAVSLLENIKNISKKQNLMSLISPLAPLNVFTDMGNFHLAAMAVASTPKTWTAVFLSFLKIGSVLYGGGYVLLAFIQQDFVERNQWLTPQELLDAIAIGQFTPGPVLTTATFIGYLVAGHLGAIAGTIGIFLPAFIFVPLVNPLVSKLRQSPWTSGFLNGVNAASVGLMLAVTVDLGRSTLINITNILIAIASLAILIKFPKVNSLWLVLAGAAIGAINYLLGL